MAYLKYNDVNGVLIARYLQISARISTENGVYKLAASFQYGKQVWWFNQDFNDLDIAKTSADLLVINSYGLPAVSPPDPSPRQQALLRYTAAMKIWVSFGNGRTQVPPPRTEDFLNDPNYVWPYMNANPTPVRPGGGDGGVTPRPV